MYANGLADAPVIRASRISAFRRFLTGLARLIKRPHVEPAGPSPVRPPLEPVCDPEMAQALVRLRNCVIIARELVPPAEWNAKLEWILGSESYSKTRATDFDRETIDAVVLGLEDLAASVNRTPPQTPEDTFEAARRDHLSRQSVVRGLRDATVGYVHASGFPDTSADSSVPPDSQFPY